MKSRSHTKTTKCYKRTLTLNFVSNTMSVFDWSKKDRTQYYDQTVIRVLSYYVLILISACLAYNFLFWKKSEREKKNKQIITLRTHTIRHILFCFVSFSAHHKRTQLSYDWVTDEIGPERNKYCQNRNQIVRFIFKIRISNWISRVYRKLAKTYNIGVEPRLWYNYKMWPKFIPIRFVRIKRNYYSKCQVFVIISKIQYSIDLQVVIDRTQLKVRFNWWIKNVAFKWFHAISWRLLNHPTNEVLYKIWNKPNNKKTHHIALHCCCKIKLFTRSRLCVIQ